MEQVSAQRRPKAGKGALDNHWSVPGEYCQRSLTYTSPAEIRSAASDVALIVHTESKSTAACIPRQRSLTRPYILKRVILPQIGHYVVRRSGHLDSAEQIEFSSRYEDRNLNPRWPGQTCAAPPCASCMVEFPEIPEIPTTGTETQADVRLAVHGYGDTMGSWLRTVPHLDADIVDLLPRIG